MLDPAIVAATNRSVLEISLMTLGFGVSQEGNQFGTFADFTFVKVFESTDTQPSGQFNVTLTFVSLTTWVRFKGSNFPTSGTILVRFVFAVVVGVLLFTFRG